MIILYIFSFLGGLCSIFAPANLFILPIVLAAGTTKDKGRPFGVALGLIITFTFFTFLLTSLVQTVEISATILRNISITILFLFGSAMLFPAFSRWFFQLALLGKKIQVISAHRGFVGGLILGCAMGLLWTPTAGPILAAIIALIALEAFTWMTFGLILTHAVGAAIPIFFIVLGSSALVRFSKFLNAHLDRVRQVLGGLTVLVALVMAFHWDALLAQRITRFIPIILPGNNPFVQEELQKVIQKEISPGVIKEFPIKKAPELIGISNWINSHPITLHQLKGRVVLLNFWSYSNVPCLRTIPYLEEWYKKYKDKGFIVIGIHTPEFEFAANPNNVIKAVHELGITYPVAQDNASMVWGAYQNHFWPANYLIDRDGNLVFIQFGEGGYSDMERRIQELLAAPV